MTVHVHARQFLIGPEPCRMTPDWVFRSLDHGLVLSSCPRLGLSERPQGLVLGLAADTEDGDGPPETWAGRWVLIAGRRLQMDAAGTLGCFHRRTPAGTWVSSSPEILRLIEPGLPLPSHPLERGRGMSWYPPPASGITGVDRLLPSQMLDLVSGAVEPRRLLVDDALDGYAEILARLRRRLVAAVRGAAAQRSDLWIALTGGRDSRVILAAAVSAGVRATTYTFDDETMAAEDRELPPVLAKAVGFEHRRIQLLGIDAGLAELFDRHTAGHGVDAPRDQVIRGGWHRLPPSATALGGLCFEVARCFYHRRLPAVTHGPDATATAILRALPSGTPDGIRRWAAWAAGSDEPSLDWRDRFYLEQRLAGWAGSNAQGVDATGRELVHLASCGAFISDLLRMPLDLRCSGRHQRDLVASMAPELAGFPSAPPRRRTRDILGRTTIDRA